MDTDRRLQRRLFCITRADPGYSYDGFISCDFCDGRTGSRISAYVYGKCCIFPGMAGEGFWLKRQV